jgi:hypothetical protein
LATACITGLIAEYTAVKRSWFALVLVYLSIGGALLLLLVYPRLPKV